VKPASEKTDTAVTTDVDGLWVDAGAADKPKCGRCWHHREDVGSHSEDEDLCQRCIDNVYGEGEQRQFA
jgi:isoleucyl-tRNA synthetase